MGLDNGRSGYFIRAGVMAPIAMESAKQSDIYSYFIGFVVLHD